MEKTMTCQHVFIDNVNILNSRLAEQKEFRKPGEIFTINMQSKCACCGEIKETPIKMRKK